MWSFGCGLNKGLPEVNEPLELSDARSPATDPRVDQHRRPLRVRLQVCD